MPFSHSLETEHPWPTSTGELAPGEQFIVWSFRRWVSGLRQNTGDHWSLVWDEFARQLGPEDGRYALSGFAGMIKALQCHARRRIRYHQPCCPYLGADEVSIVSFVSACQNRQPALARSLTQWLVRAEGTDELLAAGHRLADSMLGHSLTLPQRCGASAPPPSTVQSRAEAALFH